MTRRPPWPLLEDGEPIEPPISAGRLLADLHPVSIDVRGLSGAYWACADRGRCAVQTVTPSATGSLAAARLEHNAADDAWDFTLLLPRFMPSAPAISPQ